MDKIDIHYDSNTHRLDLKVAGESPPTRAVEFSSTLADRFVMWVGGSDNKIYGYTSYDLPNDYAQIVDELKSFSKEEFYEVPELNYRKANLLKIITTIYRRYLKKRKAINIGMHFYTPSQVAKALQVGPKTITKLIQSGEIIATKVGSQYRIPDDVFINLLEKNANEVGKSLFNFYIAMGDIYFEKAKNCDDDSLYYHMAIRKYNDALQLHQDDAMVHFKLLAIYTASGDKKLAEQERELITSKGFKLEE